MFYPGTGGSVSVPEDLHLLLALTYPEETASAANPKPQICGGVVFEYYPETNCGLLTYLLVSGSADRAERMAKALVQRAVEILDQNARTRGHLAGCNAIFLEITAAPSSFKMSEMSAEPDGKKEQAADAKSSLVTSSQSRDLSSAMLPVNSAPRGIEISEQHALLEKMGWRMLDFDYVMPPLSAFQKKITSIFLTVLVTPRIPAYTLVDYQANYLPRSLLKNFITTFWTITCSRTGYDFANDVDYKRMMDQINRREKVPLLELPWERPWTIVDLVEDYDSELLKQFYDQLVQQYSLKIEGKMKGEN